MACPTDEEPAVPDSPYPSDQVPWPLVTRRNFLYTAGAAAASLAATSRNVLAETPTQSEGSVANPDAVTGVPVSLTVNGMTYRLQIEARLTLLDALRETIGLTGTKKGCDRGQCGACTVLYDGRRINSCLALAVMHQDSEITTIEGLASKGSLHPVQAAFVKHDGFQCGYCTPGQICSAVALISEVRDGAPSAATRDVRQPVKTIDANEIRERMSGNICRCGAYPNIVSAVDAVLKESI